MKEIDVLGPYKLEPGSYLVAMVLGGYVYGVLLVGPDSKIQRAWIDPELPPDTICERMEFRHDDPDEVLKAMQRVLDVRPIPERNVNEFYFDLSTNAAAVTKR